MINKDEIIKNVEELINIDMEIKDLYSKFFLLNHFEIETEEEIDFEKLDTVIDKILNSFQIKIYKEDSIYKKISPSLSDNNIHDIYQNVVNLNNLLGKNKYACERISAHLQYLHFLNNPEVHIINLYNTDYDLINVSLLDEYDYANLYSAYRLLLSYKNKNLEKKLVNYSFLSPDKKIIEYPSYLNKINNKDIFDISLQKNLIDFATKYYLNFIKEEDKYDKGLLLNNLKTCLILIKQENYNDYLSIINELYSKKLITKEDIYENKKLLDDALDEKKYFYELKELKKGK